LRLGAGPINLEGATRARLEGLAAQAVASSFDAVWVAESRAQGVGGGLAAAAMVAQAVPIRVGAVVDVGAYHPLYLAEDIAVADLTSQGRIEVLLRMTGGWGEEHLQVLASALSGAHIRWRGEHLRIPAGIEANQPAPERLALNPRPAQPVVPLWIEASEPWIEQAARAIGFGVAARWRRDVDVPAATGRWPGMLLCPAGAQPDALLMAAGEGAGYFLVSAETEDELRSAGRRLVGPLRMPGFPEWVNSEGR
jgi:alkanesulfonate monooxygenase SsuD/methylene tetrahydromethanopterin reductase-like flavin-dependent oxidoreductase (luciferase family)